MTKRRLLLHLPRYLVHLRSRNHTRGGRCHHNSAGQSRSGPWTMEREQKNTMSPVRDSLLRWCWVPADGTDAAYGDASDAAGSDDAHIPTTPKPHVHNMVALAAANTKDHPRLHRQGTGTHETFLGGAELHRHVRLIPGLGNMGDTLADNDRPGLGNIGDTLADNDRPGLGNMEDALADNDLPGLGNMGDTLAAAADDDDDAPSSAPRVAANTAAPPRDDDDAEKPRGHASKVNSCCSLLRLNDCCCCCCYYYRHECLGASDAADVGDGDARQKLQMGTDQTHRRQGLTSPPG
jgi:hypothetical protein